MSLKKILKTIGAISFSLATIIGSTALFNTAIFKMAKKKDENFVEGNYYDWEHGKVHYIKKGSGKPILLLHSTSIGSSYREFENNIEELSKKYTVYAVDLPGFGYSDKPKITYTAFIYAGFIRDFIKDVVGRKVSVVAANGSGMFATITAKLFPEWIHKLVLVSPSGIVDEVAENNDIFARTIMELPLKGTSIYNYFASKSKIKKFLVEDGFFAPHFVDQQVLDSFYFGAHGTDGNARYAYASYITKYMNIDIKDYFKTINQNIYVIWGEENKVNPIENMEKLKAINESIDFFVFEETKLFPHIENYEGFNNIIKETL